jgi:hypothetical protein
MHSGSAFSIIALLSPAAGSKETLAHLLCAI